MFLTQARLTSLLQPNSDPNPNPNPNQARLTSLLQTDATACMSNLDDRLDTGRRQGAEMQSRRSEMEVSNIARDAVSRRSVGDWLDETKATQTAQAAEAAEVSKAIP